MPNGTYGRKKNFCDTLPLMGGGTLPISEIVANLRNFSSLIIMVGLVKNIETEAVILPFLKSSI